MKESHTEKSIWRNHTPNKKVILITRLGLVTKTSWYAEVIWSKAKVRRKCCGNCWTSIPSIHTSFILLIWPMSSMFITSSWNLLSVLIAIQTWLHLCMCSLKALLKPAIVKNIMYFLWITIHLHIIKHWCKKGLASLTELVKPRVGKD